MDFLIHNSLCMSQLFLPGKCRMADSGDENSLRTFSIDFPKNYIPIPPSNSGPAWLCDLWVLTVMLASIFWVPALCPIVYGYLLYSPPNDLARLVIFSHKKEGPEAQRDPIVQSYKERKKSRCNWKSSSGSPLPVGQAASHTQTAACYLRRRWNHLLSHSVFLDAEFWFHFQVATQASSKLPISLPLNLK